MLTSLVIEENRFVVVALGTGNAEVQFARRRYHLLPLVVERQSMLADNQQVIVAQVGDSHRMGHHR